MFAKVSWATRVLSALLVGLVAFTSTTSTTLTAADAPPSADERVAVAVLTGKGSTILIDGDFQVAQVFGGRDLTNADLQHLRVFKKLKTLSLSNAQIDDEALETLKSLKELQSLQLAAESLSEKAQKELQQSLPKCRLVVPARRGSRGGPPSSSGSTPNPADPPRSWGMFEFPPLTPPPSISLEIRSSAVQERLKLSAEQKQEIDRVTGRDYQRQQIEDAIKKVLTAEQKTLIQQVLLQREGPTALVLPGVAQDLKLTKEQQAAIQSVMDSRRDQLIKIGDQLRDRTLDFSKSTQEATRIKQEANEKLLAILTESQRQTWNAKIGPPLPPSNFGGSFNSQTPEETARFNFRSLDRDNDNQLTAEEWKRSRNTRARFEQAKIELALPIKVEAFVKKYLEMMQADKENRK